MADLCGKQKFPKRFEGRFVCTEDQAEPAAVVTVYQSDQVGRAKVVCVIVFSFGSCGTGRTILTKAVSASKASNPFEQFFSLPLVVDASAARRPMPYPQSLPSCVTIPWVSRQTPTALVSPLAHDFNIAFTPWLRRRGLRDRAWPMSTPTLFLQPLTLAVAAGCCGGVHMA